MGIILIALAAVLILAEIINFIITFDEQYSTFHAIAAIGIGIFVLMIGVILVTDNDVIRILRDKIQSDNTRITTENGNPVEMWITIEGEEYHIILDKDKVKKED